MQKFWSEDGLFSDWGTDYVKISILDENKKEIIDDVKLTRMSRKDLVEVGFVEEKILNADL